MIDSVQPIQNKDNRLYQKQNQWVCQFRIRDKPVEKEHVDVIIPWHCESNEWIADILSEISSLLTIVLLHKVDTSYPSRPQCKPYIPDTNIETVYITLPNEGPDIQSLFAFINSHYDALAAHTFYLPADYQWKVGEFMPWDNQK
eukprot:13900319-Ditylum_brightwellii.AAC.1